MIIVTTHQLFSLKVVSSSGLCFYHSGYSNTVSVSAGEQFVPVRRALRSIYLIASYLKEETAPFFLKVLKGTSELCVNKQGPHYSLSNKR